MWPLIFVLAFVVGAPFLIVVWIAYTSKRKDKRTVLAEEFNETKESR